MSEQSLLEQPAFLSLIFPCYNEESHLEGSIARIIESLSMLALRFEIILVDDASTDLTRSVIDKIILAYPDVTIRKIFHKHNLGRGAAFLSGFEISTGDIAGFFDVDLEISPAYIFEALHLVLHCQADLALGNRRYQLTLAGFPRYVISKGYRCIVNFLLQLGDEIDTECGFKIFRRKALERHVAGFAHRGWFWDTAVVTTFCMDGLRILPFPCVFQRRPEKKSTVRPFLDSLVQLRQLAAFCWTGKGRSRIREKLALPARRLRGPALFALAAAVFTAVVIRYSFLHGRLSQALTADDLNYIADGARRLDTLQSYGLGAFLQNITRWAEHSPFSSYMAAFSLALFGMHDWAPYASNVPLVFALLYFCNGFLKNVSPLFRALLLAFVLTVPLTLLTVHEYRPDIAAGLFTAFAVVQALCSHGGEGPLLRISRVAMFFCIAMWIKPTASPFTLGLCILSCGASSWLRGKSLLMAAWQGLKSGLLALCVFSPYLFVGGIKLYRYIYEDLNGNMGLPWRTPMPLAGRLLFHLTGPDGKAFLGWHLYPLLALFFTGLAYSIILLRGRTSGAGSRSWERGFLSLAGIAFVAYFLPSVHPYKAFFYGIGFQLLLFCGLIFVDRLFLTNALWARRATVALCLSGFVCWRTPVFPPFELVRPEVEAMDQDIIATLDVRTEISTLLAPLQKGANAHPHWRVFVAPDARLEYQRLQWIALKNGLPLRFSAPLAYDTYMAHPIEAMKVIQKNNFVIVGDEAIRMLPPVQFRLVRTTTGPDGRAFHILQNLNPSTPWK